MCRDKENIMRPGWLPPSVTSPYPLACQLDGKEEATLRNSASFLVWRRALGMETIRLSIRYKVRLLCTVLLIVWPHPSGLAQTVCGSVMGRVVDVNGTFVTHPAVTLKNTRTAEQRKTETDSRGDYQFACLTPDSYQLDIVSPGFKHFTRTSIDVRVGSVVPIDADLVVGSASDSVQVHGETPLLQTQESSLGQVIEGGQVQNIPLNGRNVMNLVALVPGVIPQGGTQGSTAGNYATSGDVTNVAGFGNYQIGGGLAGQSAFLFDGSSLNQVLNNDTVLIPTQDVVQEFQVVTSVPNPEFGGFSGGVASFVSKS